MLKNSMFALVVSAGLSTLSISGCEISNKCGSNLEYVDRACQRPQPDAAAVDATTKVAVDMGADNEGGAAPAASNFGATCKADTDCTGDSNFCAMQPGSSSGFCSASGCDTDPSVCPTGWSCLKFPGAPAFCMKGG